MPEEKLINELEHILRLMDDTSYPKDYERNAEIILNWVRNKEAEQKSRSERE